MNSSNVRTDRWHLAPQANHRDWLVQTQALYWAYARALMGVVFTHYPAIMAASSPCAAIERLIHCTARNPNPRYAYFDRKFYKFPSYLRRAVIEAVLGQVSSFVTRYHRWQSGRRNHRQARPPKFNAHTNLYAVLYRGQCIQVNQDDSVAKIKVFNGSDWVWIDVPIAKRRQRHLVTTNKRLSPTLICNRNGFFLAVPFEVHPTKQSGERVCAVDVGINTMATASIVGPDGTVFARRFFHRASDIDRRDKHLAKIRHKARLTMGKGGQLHAGFCKLHYRKARNISHNMAQQVSRQIVNWAIAQGASVIVFENLQGWRPKGGRKRSALKQRFHGWLHRLLVKLTEQKFVELGGGVVFVYARGTSSWAYDGSGQPKRSKANYSLATFTTGKQYNADLSASYNIAARYWADKLKLTHRKDGQLSAGRRSSDKRRMPVTLSDLWDGEAAYGREAS